MRKISGFFTVSFVLVAVLTQVNCAAAGLSSVPSPNIVIVDRGNEIEVLTQVRAVPLADPNAKGQMRLSLQSTGPVTLSNSTLGVVFNHSLRAKGYINGEITFAIKGASPLGFDTSLYPGFTKLVNPNVYLVVARTSAEFVVLFNRLKSRTDLEWVEAQVQYSGGVSSPNAVIKMATENATTLDWK